MKKAIYILSYYIIQIYILQYHFDVLPVRDRFIKYRRVFRYAANKEIIGLNSGCYV